MCQQDEWEAAGASGEQARILKTLTDRYYDLVSCNKDDNCSLYAHGVWLGINDIDAEYSETIIRDPLQAMMQEAYEAGMYDLPLNDYVEALKQARHGA